MTTRGYFITFEGPEGAGKSTQARRLAEFLEPRRPGKVVLTREPGGTPLAEKLRGIIKHDPEGYGIDERTEVLLFEAGRAHHVARVVRPALEAGSIVICDRFTDSTLAYQGAGRGCDIAALDRLNDFAAAGIVPDLTILMDLPVEAGLARTATRGEGGDRLEDLDLEFHRRLRNFFLELARRSPERFRVFDATGAQDEVHRKIIREFDHVAL